MPSNTNPKLDIGLAVRQKMSEQGASIAWLARKVNIDRGNLYKQLQNIHIYPELLLRISKTLKTDFFILYSEYLRQNFENEQINKT